ncbi:MAG: hypothetical protein ACR2K5_07010 [Pseudolabrys sp.]
MRQFRIAPALLACLLTACAAVYAVPRGVEAQHLLSIEDDPAQIADRALDGHFDAGIAAPEIEAALAGKDADLAKSFVELAHERGVTINPALTAKVEAAVAEAESTSHTMRSFAMGFVTGEPNDGAGLAGTATGDLFVFGDIRDAVREGGRMALGQPADELVLGLAGVGLAITAATYATLGEAAPARVGISLAKAARKTGALGADLTAYIGRALRQVVDWNKLKGALAGASITEPALAIRAAREAVKVARAGGLVHLVRDIGRVQSKAGTKAALDGLKIAETPREMSRLARLAAAKGGKTRAIIKLVGRGALVLTLAALDLGFWILGAALALFGFVSSLKGTTERITLRMVRRGKMRRLRAEQQRFAAMTARG